MGGVTKIMYVLTPCNDMCGIVCFQNGQLDVKYVLLFYYYGGMVYTCLHDYLKALLFFTVVGGNINLLVALLVNSGTIMFTFSFL